ncbi:MAG: hypothetical protein OXG41_10445 [Acidimicrobiaceae bacterium]|nr:hypothetical protein [Acidimicrobiaceae bacterium]
MTDLVAHRSVDTADAVLENSDRDPFAVLVGYVTTSMPTFEHDRLAGVVLAAPRYVSRRGGMYFDGSWNEVAARVESEASTSSQGSLTRGIDDDPHPKPVASSRVRQLKEDSALTWDQLRRLFGVSRRALHMWAGGAQMNSRNQERLAYLERIVSALGATPLERRDTLLSSREGGGRSIFQQLTLSVSGPQGADIEALTESTGAGRTVHGDFLFAEVIDGDEEDR